MVGSCILIGFHRRNKADKFVSWAVANLSTSGDITPRGTTPYYDWTINNFLTTLDDVPEPASTSSEALIAWAKENFIQAGA